MNQFDIPMISGGRFFFELENGHFIKFDLYPNANGDWVVEHLDSTGEFIAGLQIEASTEN